MVKRFWLPRYPPLNPKQEFSIGAKLRFYWPTSKAGKKLLYEATGLLVTDKERPKTALWQLGPRLHNGVPVGYLADT